MALYKRSRPKRMRLFFTTDIHGSDRCFRKFLAAAETYNADVLLLGGDVVGKAITPIEELSGDQYRYKLFGEEHTLPASELARAKADINFNGFYPAVLSGDQLDRMHHD